GASVTFKLAGAAITAPLPAPPYVHSLDTAQIANGLHTLLAVAKDAAGNASRSAIVQFSAAHPARYAVGPGPFTVENLGPLMQANTQERQVMFRMAGNKDLHLVL